MTPAETKEVAPISTLPAVPLRPAVLFLLLLLALRLLYLAFLCPFALVEDEAHYWEWSRHLDWSYYTKGPGIAYMIALSTRLLGDTEFGVRALSPVFSAVGGLAIAALVRAMLTTSTKANTSGPPPSTGLRAKAPLLAVIALQLAPVNQVTALLATIDGPYCACWAISCFLAWRALMHRGTLAWPLLGLTLGIGLLFKYTILLLIPGLLLFAMFNRANLALARSWRSWLVLCIVAFAFAASPVLIWNQRNGWPTLNHLMGHLGLAEPSRFSVHVAESPTIVQRLTNAPVNVGIFLGTQIGFVGPVLLLALIACFRFHRVRRGTGESSVLPHAAESFLICAAAPILLFYLLVSFAVEPEGNWPIAAYMTLLPLAGCAAVSALADYRERIARWESRPPAERIKEGFFRRKPETVFQIGWHASLAYGIGAAVLMLAMGLARHAPETTSRFFPIGRLTQGPDFARAVQTHIADLQKQTGREPIVMAQHYGRASHLAFYLPGHPNVYCTSAHQGGRPTAQDFWPDYDVDSPALVGRDAVMLGGNPEQWSQVFERVESLGVPEGVVRKGVRAFFGFGFKGIRPPSNPPSNPPSTPAPAIAAPSGQR